VSKWIVRCEERIFVEKKSTETRERPEISLTEQGREEPNPTTLKVGDWYVKC